MKDVDRVGTPVKTLYVAGEGSMREPAPERHVTRSVTTCVPTRSAGTLGAKYAEKDVTDLAELLRRGDYQTVRLLTQADGTDDWA